MNSNPFQKLHDLYQERLRKAGKVTPPVKAAEPEEVRGKKSKKKSNKK